VEDLEAGRVRQQPEVPRGDLQDLPVPVHAHMGIYAIPRVLSTPGSAGQGLVVLKPNR
jgi:hypothetical protein